MGDVWVPGGEDVVMLCGGGGKKCMCVLPGLLYLHKLAKRCFMFGWKYETLSPDSHMKNERMRRERERERERETWQLLSPKILSWSQIGAHYQWLFIYPKVKYCKVTLIPIFSMTSNYWLVLFFIQLNNGYFIYKPSPSWSQITSPKHLNQIIHQPRDSTLNKQFPHKQK